MSELVEVGQFCPKAACSAYGKVGARNIVHYGKSRQGQQRFQCKTCRVTFNAHTGTLFYGRKRSEAEILECWALLAEGVRITSISRTKGIKEDTILGWLREAARHAEMVEAVLLNDYPIGPAQSDGVWTDVGGKDKKMRNASPETTGNTGAAP